jgi:hypothetical protein
LRKYGLFGEDDYVFGIEYLNLIQDRFWTKRGAANWYDVSYYDWSGYKGRHWGANSGPDSDDFFVFFGYLGEKFTIIPAFNYERHGVIDNSLPELPPKTDSQASSNNPRIWPEVKFEFRLDLRYNYKGYNFNFYYEHEWIDNLEFREKERISNVFWIGIEKRLF